MNINELISYDNKQLMALLQVADAKDKILINKVLNLRYGFGDDNAMAEINAGLKEDMQEEEEKKAKMEQWKLLIPELSLNIGHKCVVQPLNSEEWVVGYIHGVTQSANGKPVYAIKLEDERRIIKVYDSPLLQILEETKEVPLRKIGRKRKKERMPPEAVDAIANRCLENVGKIIAFPKTFVDADGETKEFEVSGRIVAMMCNYRKSRVIYKIDLSRKDKIKYGVNYVHCVTNREDIKIEENYDELGVIVNQTYTARWHRKYEIRTLQPDEQVEFRKMQLYNTEKTLEKWQNKYQRRLNSLKYAEQRAEEYRKKYGKEEDPVSL